MKIRCFKHRLEIASPAKINWFLELPFRRDDGFHEIETVMSTVSIFDQLLFETRRDLEFQLTVENTSPGLSPSEQDNIPTDQSNLIVSALDLVRNSTESQSELERCSTGFDIHLRKNIPSAAGLGGASSNAAAALIAANRLWELNWPKAKLSELAAQLGSDIPFFLTGGTAVCRGRGEIVESIQATAGLPVVVVKPPAPLSTAKVFSNVSVSSNLISGKEMIQNFCQGDIHGLGKSMFNRLQSFAEQLTEQIGQLRRSFSEIGSCLGHQMSGSGSSYFGVFSNERSARQAMTSLFCRHPDVRIFYSKTLSTYRL